MLLVKVVLLNIYALYYNQGPTLYLVPFHDCLVGALNNAYSHSHLSRIAVHQTNICSPQFVPVTLLAWRKQVVPKIHLVQLQLRQATQAQQHVPELGACHVDKARLCAVLRRHRL